MEKKFDETKKYAQPNGVLLGDGREEDLLTHILTHPSLDTLRGCPARILALIDDFGRSKYLMNVGEHKGRIVTGLIAARKPVVMLELGGYVGYSALLFGDALRATGGLRYYSLECNADFARVSRALVDLAGLSEFVHVVVGPCDLSVERLKAEGELDHIDMLFIDHYKPAYTFDLKLCESLGLVREGSMIIADNVIHPGAPKYLDYVHSSVAQKREKVRSGEAREENPNQQNWYVKEKAVDGELVKCVVGNPNLVYEGVLVPSFEPNGIEDGLEVTRCVGEEK